jgi:hypothetical protein
VVHARSYKQICETISTVSLITDKRRTTISEYNEIQTQYSDRECLVSALEEMGYKPQVSEKPQHLQGYQNDRREQTAEIIIPRRQVGGASNDVGFKKNADGTYTAIISDYDKGSNFNLKKQNELKKIYAEKHSIKQGKANGLRFMGKKQVTNKEGRQVTRLQFVTTK